MAHAEGNITIARPVKEVFDFILDGMNNPKWRPAVTHIERQTSTPLGVGTVFKQKMKGPMGDIDGDYEIVECQPNARIKFQVIAGPARPTGTYQFESRGDSTTVTFALDFQPKGLARMMDGMIEKTMQGEVAMLSNLKAQLEGRA